MKFILVFLWLNYPSAKIEVGVAGEFDTMPDCEVMQTFLVELKGKPLENYQVVCVAATGAEDKEGDSERVKM